MRAQASNHSKSQTLTDWLRSDQRAGQGLLNREYVSIAQLLRRLCGHRLGQQQKIPPWCKFEVESELRSALLNGELNAWRFLSGEAPSLVSPFTWSDPMLWDRERRSSDPTKPDADHDGNPVTDEAWREVLAAIPAGQFAIKRDDVLEWLGEQPTPRIDGRDLAERKRAETLGRLAHELRKHFGFDRAEIWIKKEILIAEIDATLSAANLDGFVPYAAALRDLMCSQKQKRGGRRNHVQRNQMEDWGQRMKDKRGSFVFIP